MKKIVFWLTVVFLVSAGLSVLSAWGAGEQADLSSSPSGTAFSEVLDFTTEVTKLDLSGGVEFSAAAGDEQKITLHWYENYRDLGQVRVDSDGRLWFDWNRSRLGTIKSPRLEIVTRSLESLELSGGVSGTVSGYSGNLESKSSGGVDLTLKDLTGNHLQISSSGGVKTRIYQIHFSTLDVSGSGGVDMTADNSSAENLTINGSGGAGIDFKGLKAVNAQIKGAGGVDYSLTMDGGSLQADLNGGAMLDWYGTASQMELDGGGATSIRHRD